MKGLISGFCLFQQSLTPRLTFAPLLLYQEFAFPGPDGGMVDAQVSGTCGSNTVEVRVLFWAPKRQNHMKKRFLLLFLSCLCWAPVSLACSYTEEYFAVCDDINGLFKESGTVVEATVSKVEVKEVEGGNIFTYIDFDVTRYIKGTGEKNITTRHIGGKIGDMASISSCPVADFTEGQHGYVYFADKKHKDFYILTCSEKGIMDKLPDGADTKE
jgi:hypothetical protein